MHMAEFVNSCLLLLGIFFFKLLGSCRVGFRNLYMFPGSHGELEAEIHDNMNTVHHNIIVCLLL